MDIKIVDVAKRAGVSPATVSRVLNDSNLVTEKTKRKVLAIIEEMEYHPHAAAKQLRSQRTMTIGVIVPDINVSYFSEIIKGIENMAYAKKYKLIICDSDNTLEKETEYLELLKNRTVDAMVLVMPFMNDEELYELADKGFLIGVVGRNISHDGIPTCKTDNVKFSHVAVNHLLEQGHRSIAYIGGYSDSAESYERLEGYMKALKDHQVPFQPSLIDNGDYQEMGGYNAMNRLMDSGTPFSAIYVANDEMALGVYRVCLERNVRIPEDMAVIGVDNNRISRYINPPLSTVNQPKYAMGALIAEKLIDLMTIKEFAEKKDWIIHSDLIVRESSNYQRNE
ncbi:transcriptional regulator, LacI family [Paenibacillus curdlanolyticus YK9]|uniref:Transcriptional regulator, LacI family n=1 Tax=Paenibacillus curdlanolyticus YK9 TaxID=717606 RepID=E0IBL7_9BACL|nr:LacI family DNA-binding transcriptional regulator [Paenibacillus curdlanolyticus]EFM10097.1 transcriptional regulator, LacI family [Paenibacillus curdlanolyticus YK9]